MELQIKELIKASEGQLLSGSDESEEKFSISTDTRTITPSNFFLPLSGENFDGHNFIAKALEEGCKGYFIDKNFYEKEKKLPRASFIILVEDTLIAYLKISNYVRKKINPAVIAVTGSSGKTTTKEFIYSVLKEKFRTHKSRLNHNNEIGLCQTLLNMPQDTEKVVIEMGMRGLGEIEQLSKYSEPDIAVISNIGTAHIGRLGSIENIAKAKCEIVKYLNRSGILIAFDDELIRNTLDWTGKTVFYGAEFKVIEQGDNFSRFSYKDTIYEIPTGEEYNILNSMAAIEIGLYSGMEPGQINAGLKKYAPVGDRGSIVNLRDNVKIIKDCYNANPDSMKASISSVIKTYPGYRIYLVLGDMLELGEFEESLHREVGKFISGKPVYEVITVGQMAKFISEEVSGAIKTSHFDDSKEVSGYLAGNIEKNSVVLLKASRSMKFEEIIDSYN